MSNQIKGMANLSERRRVQPVLAGNLETDVVAGLGVPGCLGASLNLGVDTVVVAGREQGEVVASGDGSRVLGKAVTNGSRVLSDSSLLHIVATLSTNQEALVTKDDVQVGSRSLEKVEEGTSVQVRLLEVQVQLSTLGLGAWQVLREDLGLETLGNVVVQLKLGVESISGGPSLGESKA